MLLCCRQKCVNTLTLFKRTISRGQIAPNVIKGAQWLSGGVLDSRPRGCGFELNRRHCAVSLNKT